LSEPLSIDGKNTAGERKRDVEGKCASGGKKKSGIYDFSGAPSEKREENDIQPGDCGGAVRW